MKNHFSIIGFKLNKKYLFISFLGMFLAGLFIIVLFYNLYNTSKESLINLWKNDVTDATNGVDSYLSTPADAVEFLSVKLNSMINSNASSDEISAYLASESEVYSKLIEGSQLGIYGYFNGEYLNGTGWVLDEAYEPTERPWYKAALDSQGRAVITTPYLSAETHTMMITACKLLDDGKSVVAMDLFLEELEDYVQRLTVENNAEAAIIIDKNGTVIAHSNYMEVGKNYNTEWGDAGRQLVDALVTKFDGSAVLSDQNGSHAAFFDRCNKGWYVVLIMDEKSAFISLRIIYILAALALIVVLVIIFFISSYMGHKQNEVEHLSREVLAVADIYVSMLHIDLDTDTVSVVRGNEDVDRLLGGNFESFSFRTDEFAEKMCAEHFRDMLKSFLDVDTLYERMENVNTISCEFVDDKDRWVRMRYIALKRDESGHMTQLLLAIESIDDDKKKQEKLRVLSETDRMTGIMNRGSGEQRIREKLSTADGGMFCLMDADKFKYVNDTFGHSVGDKVLIAIAHTLKDSFRDSDVVFRLGGDEFAAFAVGVKDSDIGMIIMDRFFKKLDLIDIPELKGHKISVSVGAAFYDSETHEPFEKLYERADKGTYQSKKTTGNMVTFM